MDEVPQKNSDSMDQSQQKKIGSFFAPHKKKKKMIRPTGSQLWKKVGNINVYHADFSSMDTGCWITDTIIDAFSSLLPTTDNKVVFNARFFLQIKNEGWSTLEPVFHSQAPRGLTQKYSFSPFTSPIQLLTGQT